MSLLSSVEANLLEIKHAVFRNNEHTKERKSETLL